MPIGGFEETAGRGYWEIWTVRPRERRREEYSIAEQPQGCMYLLYLSDVKGISW